MRRREVLPVVLSVLLAGFVVAGLALSRDSDDEVLYTALAAKIGSGGLASYNLRNVSIEPDGDFWKIEAAENGNVLPLLSRSGVGHYDTGLFFNPPLFPVMLAASHELFAQGGPYRLLKHDKAPAIRWGQFYAVLPNAALGVLFLLGIFRLGNVYFSERTGALAFAFCLTSPVFLVTVFKVWTDLLAATLLVWSFFLWQKGKESGSARTVLSAVFFGLAVLTRVASLAALPLFLTRRWKPLLVWTCVAGAVCGYWFWAMNDYYGSPFYFPQSGALEETTRWFGQISRPWYFYLFDLVYLSPVFLLGFLAGNKRTGTLAVWALLYLSAFSALLYGHKALGLEDRYLLPCYPALALLAARGFENLEKRAPKAVCWSVLGVASLWSIKTAVVLVLSRESLTFVPF
jgi:hypothetical protein